VQGYTPLFAEIVTSSIWNEDNAVRIVWITLMAIADKDGCVQASIAGLAPVARVTIPECEKAISILSSPDKYSRSQELEGRRIMAIPGGFKLINHRKYRQKAKSRAEYFRKWREEKKKLHQKEKKTLNTNTNSNSDTGRNKAQHVALFDIFWEKYPKKVGKGYAKKCFLKLKPTKKRLDEIIKAIDEQKASDQWKKDNGRYIPNPSTWINQERWGDELPHEETIAEMHDKLKRSGQL
jgi:hypothetical protein